MKRELRKGIIKERMSLKPEEVKQKSELIANRLFSLEEFEISKTVMLYLDFRNEVATEAIIQECFSQGKRVLIPITQLEPPKLIPSELKDYPGDLTTGTYGILEPQKDKIRLVEPEEIDLVLVPGVAFDIKGNRLGYGGGFYDRFLNRTKPGTPFIALAFELQVRDEVYPEPHDHPVHYVITEERVIQNQV